MYSYDFLLEKLRIYNNLENRKILKSIVHALLKSGDAIIVKQLIDVDYNKVKNLYNILNELSSYFDYSYNTKIDLTSFLIYILNEKPLSINAIFCPGYTSDGYKDYVGTNNSKRIENLSKLSQKFDEMGVEAEFKIMLANIFLENTDYFVNSNWQKELKNHEIKFIELSKKFFNENEILKLSDIYSGEEYVNGFVDEQLCFGKVYNSFYKNNIDFYKKMNWTDNQIKFRNDRLFTIYSIISQYINCKENGVYIPMETMYSRSKVMTKNNVCTMYLLKR